MRTFDGLDLHVRTYGPTFGEGARLTVLLAHCWTSDHDDWRYQIRDLMQTFGHDVRIVAWDHRGHGESEASPRAACTIDNLAHDMADVIATHAPDGPLVLAGHSIGGMTMMALAEQRPDLVADRVAAALFVSTSSGGLDEVSLGLPELGARLKSQIPRMLAMRARTLSRRARRRAPVIERLVMTRLVFGQPQRVRDTALAVEGLINSPAATMVGFYTDCMRHERTAALGCYRGLPSAVLVGSGDRLTPPAHARRMATALAAPLTIAPGAGHMLPLERDALVSGTLVRLVRRALAA